MLTGWSSYLTLNDPDRRNALSDALLDQLGETLAARGVRHRGQGHRADVVTPAGLLFGRQSRRVRRRSRDDREVRRGWRVSALYRTLTGIGKPVVCAASGDVLAGALGIAMACDLVIAKESIRLGCPEINVGAFPFMISALIFRATGRLVANETDDDRSTIQRDTRPPPWVWSTRWSPTPSSMTLSRQWVADIAGKSPLLRWVWASGR